MCCTFVTFRTSNYGIDSFCLEPHKKDELWRLFINTFPTFADTEDASETDVAKQETQYTEIKEQYVKY